MSRFDHVKMNELEIYLMEYCSLEEDPEEFEYIWEKFEFLRNFVRQRAEEKSAMILYYS